MVRRLRGSIQLTVAEFQQATENYNNEKLINTKNKAYIPIYLKKIKPADRELFEKIFNENRGKQKSKKTYAQMMGITVAQLDKHLKKWYGIKSIKDLGFKISH